MVGGRVEERAMGGVALDVFSVEALAGNNNTHAEST